MTSSIQNSWFADPAGGSGSAILPGTDNRQRWLQAMESSGLREALDKTGTIRSGEAKTSSSLDAGNEGPRQKRRQTGNGELASSDHQSGMAVGAISPEPEAASDEVLARGRPTLATSFAGAPEGAVLRYLEAPGLDQDTHKAAAVPSALATVGKTWRLGNMLVLPSQSGGVEIWLRDARLSPADADRLASDIRRAAVAAGHGQVALYINGLPHSTNLVLHKEVGNGN
jgi:hypothetical protein